VEFIYLDQKDWVYLSRAEHGRDDGEAFADVLAIAKGAVRLNRARFPLSSCHYMETWKAKQPERRTRLAQTMLALSQNVTIAAGQQLLPGEIDRALQARFGRPHATRDHPAFGEGLGHAIGKPGYGTYHLPEEIARQLPPGERDRCEAEMRPIMRQALLSGVAPEGSSAPAIDPELYELPSLTYRRSEERLVALFKEYGAKKSVRDLALAVLSAEDLKVPLDEALLRAGIAPDEFSRLGEDQLTFLAEIPSRHVDFELHRLRHDNAELPRRDSDLIDLAALSVAVVYCDVVVTEKFWTDMIRRAGLDKRYNTTVLPNLHELKAHLLS
jgi:hypothetical protein